MSKSISKKRHEGIPEKQAVAESLSMQRSGRLDAHGNYIRKKKR